MIKRFAEMDAYEQEIAKELHAQFPEHYTLDEAIRIVEQYYSGMSRIGWYWLSEEWAENLHNLIQNGIGPEEFETNSHQMERMIHLLKT